MGRKKSGDDDSVSLDDLGGAPSSSGAAGVLNLRVLIALFIVFIITVSDVFTDNVVAGFRGAVKGRTPTSYGVVVQGIFLVIFFILSVHFAESGVI